MRKHVAIILILWLMLLQPALAQSFSPDYVRTDKAQTLTNKVLGASTTFSADILPSSAGARSIGSTALPLLNILLGNGAGQSNGFDVSALTGNRTTTIPDANTSLPIPSASMSSGGIFDADLDALAGLSTTGILARTAAATYVPRTITGTASEVEVTNGDGVSGNPTIGLPATAVTPGSYTNTDLTVDANGRITAAASGSGGGSSLGGDGSDGAKSVTSTTDESGSIIAHNFTTVTVDHSTAATAATWTVSSGQPIFATGAVTVGDGTNADTIDTKFAFGHNSTTAHVITGAGPSGGGSRNIDSGGGGGCGGKGGDGQTSGGAGGAAITAPFPGMTGSNGGQDNLTGGTIGSGGGRLVIVSQAKVHVQASAFIKANGENATDSGNATECGAGSGGAVAIYSTQDAADAIDLDGEVEAKGGNGADASVRDSGSGGGGWYIAVSPQTPLSTGTIDLAGGTVTAGGASNGAAGQSLELAMMPSVPLIAWMHDDANLYNGEHMMAYVARIEEATGNHATGCLIPGRYVLQWMPRDVANMATKTPIEFAHFLNDSVEEETCLLEVGDKVEKLDNAA